MANAKNDTVITKKYGEPYYDYETQSWKQQVDYVEENGNIIGIGYVDKAHSIDLLEGPLTEKYNYGKAIGGAANTLTWAKFGHKLGTRIGGPYGSAFGTTAGGLLGAVNGYTGMPGALFDVALIDGVRALRSLDNLTINGVNINPVEYDKPSASKPAKAKNIGVSVPDRIGLGITGTSIKRETKPSDVNVGLLSEPPSRFWEKEAVLDLGKWAPSNQNAPRTTANDLLTPAEKIKSLQEVKERLVGGVSRNDAFAHVLDRQRPTANSQEVSPQDNPFSKNDIDFAMKDHPARTERRSGAATPKTTTHTSARAQAEEKQTLSTFAPARSINVASIDMLGENAISNAMTEKSNASATNLAEDSSSQTSSTGDSASTARGSRASQDWGNSIRDRMRTASRRANDINSSSYDKAQAGYDMDRLSGESTAQKRGAARSANAVTPSKNGKTGDVGSFGRHGQLDRVGNQKAQRNQTNRARNKDGSYSLDSDGNGAGDAGGTVICTELYRQGLLSHDVYRADQRFGMRLMRDDPYVISGYHFWAKPIVRMMCKSKLFTHVVHKSVGEAWAKEMALIEGLNGTGTVRGKLLVTLGVPVCRMIGRTLARYHKTRIQPQA